MDNVKLLIEDDTVKVDNLQNELESICDISEEIKEQHRQLISWAEVFDSASIEGKRMIASYIIKAVTITRDYNLKIEFNKSEAQYLNGMQME